jgi:transposase
MMEGELQEEQWALIAPLLPPPKARGRPWADDRRTINGILWVLRSGAPWKDLPPKYGSRSTCHRQLQEWQDQGVWGQLRLVHRIPHGVFDHRLLYGHPVKDSPVRILGLVPALSQRQQR